jgi:hypothetical protein
MRIGGSQGGTIPAGGARTAQSTAQVRVHGRCKYGRRGFRDRTGKLKGIDRNRLLSLTDVALLQLFVVLFSVVFGCFFPPGRRQLIRHENI